MYLTHNGVVRATPKSEVRGVETDGVAPGHKAVSYTHLDEPHDSGPGFIDLNFAILVALIPQKQSREMIDSLGVSMADGPGDIF